MESKSRPLLEGVELEMSEEQKEVRDSIKKGTFYNEVVLKSRPKTSVRKEEARQYDLDEEDETIIFTSEIKIQISEDGKYINEFKVLNTIGKGAYSKVKHVIRQYTEDGQVCEDDYA